MIEQILVLFSEFWDFIWEERVWIIPVTAAIIIGIATIYYTIIRPRKKKNGKTISHVHKGTSGVSTSLTGSDNTQIVMINIGKDVNEKSMEITKKLTNLLFDANEDLKKLRASGSKAKEEEKLKERIAFLEEKIKADEATQTQLKRDKSELEKQLEKEKTNDELKGKALEELDKGNYNTSVDYLKQSAKEKIGDVAETFHQIGKIKNLQLQFMESLEYFELAVKLQPLNSLYLNGAGLLSDTMGKYDEAIKYYTRAIENETEDSSPKAALLNNIGSVWNSKGQYEKAIEYYEKALTIDKKFYGEEHPDIAIRYNNIGSVWNSKGQYEKAIEYYEKALEIDKKIYGEEHPNIATYYNNIGGVWKSMGQYDKTIEYCEKALVINIKFHGEVHPYIAAIYNTIGLALNSKGEYDKAIEYYEKALSINKKFLGEEHPDIATDYNNIGLAWNNKGQYNKAIGYYEKALTINIKLHGEEHPSIAIRYNNIGGVWNSKGQYDKAIEYYEKALPICKKYLGENHPSTKTVAENLELARKARDEK